jgi:hypothetical protein
LFYLVLSGLLTGVAALFKQVGVFNLLCFGLSEIFWSYRETVDGVVRRGAALTAVKGGLKRLSILIAGFALMVLLLIIWLESQGTLSGFWHSVFEMGSVYVGALPADLWLRFMIGRTMGYVLFNVVIWLLAGYAVVGAIRFSGTRRRGSGESQGATRNIELLIALWGGTSLLAAFTGGRFFGHYFIQVLPALSLLGARGVGLMMERRGDAQTARRSRIALAVLTLLFIVGFVRFHQRTAVLAYEWVTGVSTAAGESWGMTQRQREAESVAQRLREITSDGEPVYIWGSALDVYWRSRCRPASRYLLPYYMTGRLQETGTVDRENAAFWSEARANFIDDLKRERPRLILDVESNMLSPDHPEIAEFVRSNYRRDGEIGVDPDRPFVVYRLFE